MRILKLLIVTFGLSACSAHRFFYMPNKNLYVDPARVGLTYEMLEIPSLNGKKLFAIEFKTDQPPKGTVVHFHGNFANVSNHFPQSQFLVRYGYDVICFDYQGYGASEGKPTPKRTVEDGVAVVRYAHEHARDKNGNVVIFGQSLGGAVGIVVAAREPLVKAMLVESSFTSYRAIARDVLRRSWMTWILQPITYVFLGSTYDPVKYIAKISPRPVLIIHGTADTVVPFRMGEELFARAAEPKEFWAVEKANHLMCKRLGGKTYETKIANFFDAAISNNN
jgi:fermentation-respiration switch protein FrsA (DUF1100 family)